AYSSSPVAASTRSAARAWTLGAVRMDAPTGTAGAPTGTAHAVPVRAVVWRVVACAGAAVTAHARASAAAHSEAGRRRRDGRASPMRMCAIVTRVPDGYRDFAAAGLDGRREPGGGGPPARGQDGVSVLEGRSSEARLRRRRRTTSTAAAATATASAAAATGEWAAMLIQPQITVYRPNTVTGTHVAQPSALATTYHG